MEAKTTEWRPGPTVCRCCLAEGCYKDISTEYFWMGKREVYAEMLLETFDLNISYSQSGGPNSNSRLICEPCISRLRDAADFKRQVTECERSFTQYLDPVATDVDVDLGLEKEVKIERVKDEKSMSDDEFVAPEFVDDDDDDDDLDDQPLTKLASKIPKKESVDVLDLLDNAKVTEKRKSSSKTKSSPAKKSKLKKEVASSSKVKPEPRKKKEEWSDPARGNAGTIIKCTTAYPFRVNDKCIVCVYCQELYDDPELFRRHMDDEHPTFNVKVAFHNIPKLEFIKADLTELRCRLCDDRFDSLEVIAEHLKSNHNEAIDLNARLGVMPYVLRKDFFNCVVCGKNCPSLFHLNRHTITHFLSYVCHFCGKSYVATTGLLRHVRSKHQEYKVSCRRCGKVFPNMEAKERHRRTEKSCMAYCCSKCPERFHDWKLRKRHMETEHGQSKRIDRCADCNITFSKGSAYYQHFKLKHSKDCVVCKHCGMKFICRSRYKRHLSTHVSYTA
ncbi:zinc finger protein 850 [Danaus plexippus plexippus]|uniref:Zinc finger protein 850 n=1 Tax=Danaus plexippus plexippus TaxID=278856 RepID=A0A212FM36_DANPL|nr:histone-lysine N-methyltransferase PRDM9-like isoform X16 [Danaus plexippus plexippus]OWR54805.1 zinc finger protein 850 [Danaus plexippus plexippus]